MGYKEWKTDDYKTQKSIITEKLNKEHIKIKDEETSILDKIEIMIKFLIDGETSNVE